MWKTLQNGAESCNLAVLICTNLPIVLDSGGLNAADYVASDARMPCTD